MIVLKKEQKQSFFTFGYFLLISYEAIGDLEGIGKPLGPDQEVFLTLITCFILPISEGALFKDNIF